MQTSTNFSICFITAGQHGIAAKEICYCDYFTPFLSIRSIYCLQAALQSYKSSSDKDGYACTIKLSMIFQLYTTTATKGKKTTEPNTLFFLLSVNWARCATMGCTMPIVLLFGIWSVSTLKYNKMVCILAAIVIISYLAYISINQP